MESLFTYTVPQSISIIQLVTYQIINFTGTEMNTFI